MTITVDLIAAARPNFMKVAPLYKALSAEHGWCRPRLIHTGQHYDANMSDAFFKDLGLPDPDIHLGVGSGSHAEQTAGVMVAYEKVCMRDRPAWVIVVGDVNSTLACTLAATKLEIPVAHLEAGLRSGDRSMPEEINRLVTDALAVMLWTPSPDADENLLREGVARDRICRVGNIMIDALEMTRKRIEARQFARELGLNGDRYGVVTLHRPSNVDDAAQLSTLVEMLRAIAEKLPIVFPVHPRTRKRLQNFGFWGRIEGAQGVRLIEPVGYVEFMSLVFGAKAVITDSGGVQEETTYLGIPCITLRENTERPITVLEGTNRLMQPAGVPAALEIILQGNWPQGNRPELWDGNTAGRVVESLKKHVNNLA
jgi:UDP-N-acetylglucosamine 2-epimerase (non-hydrolysing)